LKKERERESERKREIERGERAFDFGARVHYTFLHIVKQRIIIII